MPPCLAPPGLAQPGLASPGPVPPGRAWPRRRFMPFTSIATCACQACVLITAAMTTHSKRKVAKDAILPQVRVSRAVLRAARRAAAAANLSLYEWIRQRITALALPDITD